MRRFPELRERLPWVPLGRWPTAVEELPALQRRFGCDRLFVKREDRSSPRFGGNKVRTLESLFGEARAAGAERIWSTGAYGSNHALAMVLHAELAGLRSGVLMFPQPPTDSAAGNLLAMLAADCTIEPLWSVVALPFAMARIRRRYPRDYVMPPGGATPRGALGHVSGALELAEQIAAGELPQPRRIVLAVGSTCTTAGMLVGLRLAWRMTIGWRGDPPILRAVRVTPWPVTGRANIVRLAVATSRLLASLVGEVARFSWRELSSMLEVDGHYFAGGYGKPLDAGRDASELITDAGGPWLDQVYAQKSGACFIDLARERAPGPTLYWATRSTTDVPHPTAAQLAAAPPVLQRWLRKPRRP